LGQLKKLWMFTNAPMYLGINIIEVIRFTNYWYFSQTVLAII